jgi:hypothetical protein
VLITGVLLIFSIFHFYGFSIYISKKKEKTKNTKTKKRELLCKSKRARRLTVVLPPQA